MLMSLQLNSKSVTFLQKNTQFDARNYNIQIYFCYKYKISSKVVFSFIFPSTHSNIFRNLFCWGRFCVLKSCLLWVPQCTCLSSYKAGSEIFSAWAGRPLNLKSSGLLNFYTCHFFALPLQRQPYQGYHQTGTNPVIFRFSAPDVPGFQADTELIPLGAKESTTVTSTKAAYQQPMERASNRLVASYRSCTGAVVLKQTESE